MTQQLIANMLGISDNVMRAGAQKLQDEGLLRYEDGRITVLTAWDWNNATANAMPW